MGSKCGVTFSRAHTTQISFCQGVLRLGEHRLQSLSTFHRAVKKLSHFEGRFFGRFLADKANTVLLGTLNRDVAEDRNFLAENLL